MPELGEVAHATNILNKYLAGKTVKDARVEEDPLIFCNASTEKIVNAVKGLKVDKAERLGKYFWLRLYDPNEQDGKNKETVLVMHFGMAGWIHVKGVRSHYVVMENSSSTDVTKKKIDEDEEEASEQVSDKGNTSWPPRFFKFELVADDGTTVAFSDSRRLGRVRLFESVSSDRKDILSRDPLNKLGPDYSQTIGRPDLETFSETVLKRKVPVKALLLDQSLFAGIGNWISDEILFQARIHPEQYTNTLSDEQLKVLYDKIIEVCDTAVETESNTEAFPNNWLMRYRWGKRKSKKETPVTAEGYKVAFLKVGGRTASYAPEIQKLPPKSELRQNGDAVKREQDQDDENADKDEGEEEKKEKKPSKKKARRTSTKHETEPSNGSRRSQRNRK